jgi:hypothetical protein
MATMAEWTLKLCSLEGRGKTAFNVNGGCGSAAEYLLLLTSRRQTLGQRS